MEEELTTQTPTSLLLTQQQLQMRRATLEQRLGWIPQDADAFLDWQQLDDAYWANAYVAWLWIKTREGNAFIADAASFPVWNMLVEYFRQHITNATQTQSDWIRQWLAAFVKPLPENAHELAFPACRQILVQTPWTGGFQFVGKEWTPNAAVAFDNKEVLFLEWQLAMALRHGHIHWFPIVDPTSELNVFARTGRKIMERFMRRIANNEKSWSLRIPQWSALKQVLVGTPNRGQLSLLQQFAIAALTFDQATPPPPGYISKQIENVTDIAVLTIPPREYSDIVREGMFQIWPDGAKALLVMPPI